MRIGKFKINNWFTLGFFLILFIFSFSNVFSAYNKQINYQGKLTDSTGIAVADGTYNMEFNLYTVASAGTAIWTEQRIDANKVTVSGGIFSILLGEVSTLASVDFNQTLYLGVNIGGTGTPSWDGEMTPRKKLGAVPASIVSGGAINILGGSAGTIPYQSAADTTSFSAAGTSGQALISGGSGSPTWFSPTLGSILFAGASGALTQDNANLFWDNSNDRLGIGTTAPGAKLDVQASGVTLAKIGNGIVLTSTNDSQAWMGSNNWGWNGSVWTRTASSAAVMWGTGNNAGAFEVWTVGTGDGQNTSPSDSNSKLFVANGGNVGIGTVTPGYKLDVSGTARFTGNVLIPAGQHGLSVDNAAGISIYTNELNVKSGNLYLGYRDTSNTIIQPNSGNVGIGTAAPQTKLHVYSGAFGGTAPTEPNILIEDSNNGVLSILTPNTAGAYLQFGDPEDVDVGQIQYIHTDNSMRFVTSGNEYMRISSSGNVGIGIVTPETKLHVASTTISNGVTIGETGGTAKQLIISYDTTNNYAGIQAVHQNTAYKNIALNPSGGNVGIGTTAPGSKLEVAGDILFGSTTNTGRIKSDGTHTMLDAIPAGGGVIIRTGGAVERMRINESGNIGIGTTGPEDLVDIYSSGANPTTTLQIRADRTSYGNVRTDLKTYAGGSTSLDRFTINIGSSGDAFNLLGNGNVGIGTTAPATKLEVAGAYVQSRGQIYVNGSDHGYISTNAPATGQAGIGFNSAGTQKWFMYRPANSDDLRISDANADKVTFQTSTGNVGIGTTAPGSKLEVTTSSTGLAGTFTQSGDGYGVVINSSGSSATRYALAVRSADTNTPYLYVTTETGRVGSVGIGTTAPGAKLHVTSQAILAGGFYSVSASDADADIWGISPTYYPSHGTAASQWGFKWQSTPNAISFVGNGTEKLNIDLDTVGNITMVAGGGSVGIGTTDIEAWETSHRTLQLGGQTGIMSNIGGASSAVYYNQGAYYDGAWKYRSTGSDEASSMVMYDGIVLFRTAAIGAADAALTWTETLRITSAGNVGIGTTAPGALLDLSGSGAQYVRITSIDNAAGFQFRSDGGGLASIYSPDTSNDIRFTTNTITDAFTIQDAGNVGIGTTAPGYKLDVNGTGRFTGAVTLDSTLTVAGTFDPNGAITLPTTGITGAGSGSGLDADLLDGQNGSYYQTALTGSSIRIRNLLLNSEFETTAGNEHMYYVNAHTPLQNYVGQSLTFSFDIKAAVAGTVLFYSSNNARYRIPNTNITGVTTSWQRVSVTLPITDANNGLTVSYLEFYGTYGTGRIPTVRNMKIEESSIATGWMPAPEDKWGYNNDGTGSGLDADLWDGNQFATYLNQSVLTSSSPTFASLYTTGNVGIGTTAPGAKLDVAGSAASATGHYGPVRITDTDAMAAGVGGGITFLGKYITASDSLAGAATIKASKSNATSGNYDYDLIFGTRVNAGDITEKMRILAGGNVGIGATAPGALLQVGGATNIQITNNGVLTSTYNSEANPRFTLNRDLGGGGNAGIGFGAGAASAIDTILYRGAADQLRTPDSLIIDGNVGIGTATPKGILHLGTTTTHTNPSTSYKQMFAGGFTLLFREARDSYIINNAYYNTSGQYINLYGTYGSTNLANYDGNFRFSTAPAVTAGAAVTFTERMTILENGNVGIGTSAPAAYTNYVGLSIGDNSATKTGFLKFKSTYNSGDGAEIYQNPSTGTIFFNTNSSTTAINILAGGNVGIGTSAPSYKLDIEGSANAALILADFQNTNTGTSAFSEINLTSGANAQLRLGVTDDGYSGWTGGSFIYSTHASGRLALGTANAEKVSILASGNVGIGTTAPARKLVVIGDGEFTTNLVVGTSVYTNTYTASAASNTQFKNSGGTDTLTIQHGGNIGIGTTAPTVKLKVDGDIETNNMVRATGWLTGTGTGLGVEIGVSSNVGYVYSYNRSTSAYGTLNLQNALQIVGSGGTVAVTNALTTGGTINSQTISSAANFTGTVTAATSVTSPAFTVTGGGQFIAGTVAQNMKLKAGGTGATGISGYDSSNVWKWQLYGDGTNYGFLNGNWASWDMMKTVGGALVLNGSQTVFTSATAAGSYPTLNQNTTGTSGGLTGTPNITVGTITSGLINGQTISSAANFTGTANVAGIITAGGVSDANYYRITNPGGGTYVNPSASSATGAIAVVLPVGMSNQMMRMTIKVYEYSSNLSFEIHAGGYMYPSGNSWINTFAYIEGNPGVDRRFSVRFGYTAGGKAVVYIGELATVWSYPQVFVTDVQVGFQGYSASFASGWSVGFQPTAFENVTATITNSQIGYAVSTNTANSVALRDASGNFSAGTITATLSGTATNANACSADGTCDMTDATLTGILSDSTDSFRFNGGYADYRLGSGSSGNYGLLVYGNGATDTYLNMQARGGYVYLADTTTYSSYFLRADGTTVVMPGTLQIGSYGGLASAPTSYGSLSLSLAKSGYYGLLMGTSTSHANLMYDGSGNGGIYYESLGRWSQYYLPGTNHLNIGTSTDLGATLGVSGTGYFSGNVGIGTTAPGSKLHVEAGQLRIGNSGSFATAVNSQGILFDNSASAAGIEFLAAVSGSGYGHRIISTDSGTGSGILRFQGRDNSASFSDVMAIRLGQVGIGTTDPTSQMSGTTGIGIYNANYPAVGFKNSTTAWLWYGTGSTLRMWNSSAADILTANTSGNVGIGTTAPGYKLDVVGNIAASTGIRLTNGKVIIDPGGSSYDTPYTVFQAHGYGSSWAGVSVAAMWDASYVTNAFTLGATMSGGTRATPTYTTGSYSRGYVFDWAGNGSNILRLGTVAGGSTNVAPTNIMTFTTGAVGVTGTLAVSSTVTGGTYNGQTISSAANFTGTAAVNGVIYTVQGAGTRNSGIIGTYDPTKLAAIWSMGSSYQIATTGANAATLYGLNYSYEPDYGGAGNNPGAISGLGHQMQWRANGVTQTAIGTGIYTIGVITGNGSGITTINASNLSSGTVPTARLGTGTANSSSYLRGDQTWATISSSQWTTTGSNIYYNTGNVGIGTTAPTKALTISAGSTLRNGINIVGTNGPSISVKETTNNVELVMESGTSYSYVGNLSYHNVQFGAGGASTMSITPAEKVGIGTTAPTEKLHIYNGNLRVEDGDGDFSDTVYASKNVVTSSQETDAQGVTFSADGTKMYIVGYGNDTVYQYTLSTAWDVSTASYASKSMSVLAQTGTPGDMSISSDGTKVYILGLTGPIYQYGLSTPWDISTGTFTQSLQMVGVLQDSSPTGIEFGDGGAKMYTIGSASDTIYQYTLGTAWDISTASYASKSIIVTYEEATAESLRLSSDGSRLFVIGSGGDEVNQYNLLIAWNISTAKYTGKTISIQSQDSDSSGLAFSSDGTKMYMTGIADKVWQYTTVVPNTGIIYASETQLVNTDLAENYPTLDTTLQAGELISLDKNATGSIGMIKRASHGDNVLGIVSTKPGILLGEKINNAAPVALKGRVPMKVNLEGGNIYMGDYIALSPTAGVGMKQNKSGFIIARALQDFIGDYENAPKTSGTIEVFVEDSFNIMPSQMTFDINGNIGIAMTNPSVALDVTGNIEYTGTITDVSDERLKENITDFEGSNALTVINSIGVKNYNLIGEEKVETGFIAQNVLEVFPEAVSIVDPEHGYMGVSYVSFVPVLAGAIQELDIKIGGIEERLQALEELHGMTKVTDESSLADTASSLVASVMDNVNSFFNNVFIKVEGSVAYLKGLVVETLKVGSADKRTGITLYDEMDGNPYCFSISNGAVKTLLGECVVIEAAEDATQNALLASGGAVSSGDITAPTLTLEGSTMVALDTGVAYQEYGFTAVDDVDTEVVVIVSGFVDENTPGIYTVTYSARDSSGNVATATREVNVGGYIIPVQDSPIETTSPEGNAVQEITIEPSTGTQEITVEEIVSDPAQDSPVQTQTEASPEATPSSEPTPEVTTSPETTTT